jgi:RecA-family ATPase
MITTADGGTGKTTLKLQEAICLATNQVFLGFTCTSPGRTLYITGEDDSGKLAAMVGRIAKQMGLLDDPEMKRLILQNVVIKTDLELCLIQKDRQGFLHPNTAALKNLLTAIEKLKPRMIVFDPIASFWGSEAGLNDMAQAVSKVMRSLVKQGVAVEMINHMGKASSATKDISQFAGRGGTGLPSHSRVSRVLHSLSAEEYQEKTGEALEPGQSSILCNVNKFSDGSDLLNKPFILLRQGYVFTRRALAAQAERDAEKRTTDLERVMTFIREERKDGRYPTDVVVIGHFMMANEPMSEARIKRALKLAEYTGHQGEKIKKIHHPDATISEKAFVIVRPDGSES